MNYKGFNIAIHELGHNVEQTFSLHGIDHWFLNGVPNTAFTEAFAMLFQERDMELLGLATPNASAAPEALGTLWVTAEIAAVSLVDMKAWHWLYAAPGRNPGPAPRGRAGRRARGLEPLLRAAVRAEGRRDPRHLLAHGHQPLYLPDYPLGHIIAFQLAETLRGPRFGDGVRAHGPPRAAHAWCLDGRRRWPPNLGTCAARGHSLRPRRNRKVTPRSASRNGARVSMN